jgi:voltage-gated potassium channel
VKVLKKLWNVILTFLALAFLVAFSWPAFDMNPSDSTNHILGFIQWASWLAFALDLVVGLARAQNKATFLKKHPLEILAVALPMLRPLRLLRVISFGSLVLEKVSIGKSVGITIKVVITTFFLGYIAAIQITITERASDSSNIKNFGDGLWWAFTTITTVGYGDRYPTTSEGRFLAVCLMILGISLLGVISATIAAWFVRMMQDESRVDSN